MVFYSREGQSPRVIELPFFFLIEQYGDQWWFRHLCAAGGVFNVLTMLLANLVGFAIGIEGTKHLIQQLCSWQGRRDHFKIQYHLIISSASRDQVFVCGMFEYLFSSAIDV